MKLFNWLKELYQVFMDVFFGPGSRSKERYRDADK